MIYIKLEDLFRVIELTLTFIGLIFIVFGWIIPYKQSLKMEKKRRESELEQQKRQWEKEQIDIQIAMFYGPISALLKEQNIVWQRIIYQLGRNCIFENNQFTINDLPEDEAKIWMHFVDMYKIPLNKKIVDIIRDNTHLVYKSEIPSCFNTFLDYTLGWELLDKQKRSGVPNYYEYHYCYNFPKEFTRYINNTLEILLVKQAELINSKELKSTVF